MRAFFSVWLLSISPDISCFWNTNIHWALRMMFKYALILFCGILSSAFALNHSSTELKSLLLQSRYQWCPKTRIYFPDDPNWANATTQRWNVYSAPSYVASVKPGCEEDVQRVVYIPPSSISPNRHIFCVPQSSQTSFWFVFTLWR